jgi:phosphohistidine swiveling domain-containing protein
VSAPPASRLLRLGGEISRTGPAMLNEATRPGRSAGPGPVGADELAGLTGAKAARLARAAGMGLPVLPGWVIPVAEGAPALGAGASAVRQGRPAAARRAVLGHRLDDALAAELRRAVAGLGGRVIARSSSPLEADPRWSGAFSSVAEVGPDDVTAAVRSCWASAFAVDPLKRLEACCLPPEALQLGVLLQPEIRPLAGGVARVTHGAGAGDVEVTVEGVPGHPGALLSGWAEGASARVRLPVPPRSAGPVPGGPARSGQPGTPRPSGTRGQPGEGGLAALVGLATVAAVADLAGRVWRLLGDNVIEWAADDNGIWLLQSQRSGPAARETAAELGEVGREAPEGQGTKAGRRAAAGGAGAGPVARKGRGAAAGAASRPGHRSWAGGLPAARASMPLLAAAVLGHGEHVPGRPGAPGTAAGRLVACRPHERPPGDCGDAILLVDQPVPALAPLLFAARGVIARTGAAGSHLAEVARSLGVPMVLGCRPERATGTADVPDGAFLAAIDGSTGDVALLPAAGAGLAASPGPGVSALSGLQYPASALPAPGSSGQRI